MTNATYTQIAPTIFEDRGLEWVDLPENRVYGVLKERRQLMSLMFCFLLTVKVIVKDN
jgi:hypothetical protein